MCDLIGAPFHTLETFDYRLACVEAHCHKVGAAAGASRSDARRAQRSDDVAALLHSVTAFLRQSPTAKPTTADHRSITMCAPLNGSRMSTLTDASCHCAGCALAVLCNFTRITISSFSVLSDGTHAILEPTCICTVTVETGVYTTVLCRQMTRCEDMPIFATGVRPARNTVGMVDKRASVSEACVVCVVA